MNAAQRPIGSLDRTCMAVIAAIGWFALALQFYLMIIVTPTPGADRVRLTFNYFSFFTILTNLLVALGLTFRLVAPRSRWGDFFSRPTVASGTAVYIAIVGGTYSLLLRSLWSPQGAQKVADNLLHDLVPIMYVAYWLVFIHKGMVALEGCALVGGLSFGVLFLLFNSWRGDWLVSRSIHRREQVRLPSSLGQRGNVCLRISDGSPVKVAIGRLRARSTQYASRD
jgi:hypothetical protein